MNITITIGVTPELKQTLQGLTALLGNTTVNTVNQPGQPVQQTPPAPVPTTAPTYTMDQLAVAATQLVDAGKRDQLVQLLQSFGAQALLQLPKEQYGAFATKLREMGAKI